MAEKKYPLTIENRWDIMYRDYPEKYDEFATTGWPNKVENKVYNRHAFKGKQVVDIGSGTGQSSFDLAPHAKLVIGVEPEKGMRDLAIKKTEELGITNVRFADGTAQNIPLPDDSVDYVTAITTTMYPPEEAIPRFIEAATRVAKRGGTIVFLDITPGWYGGELDHIIQDEWSIKQGPISDDIWRDAGFEYEDYQVVQDYGTLEKIIAVYGFIFGVKAINYLKEHNKTTIRWSYRWYTKTV